MVFSVPFVWMDGDNIKAAILRGCRNKDFNFLLRKQILIATAPFISYALLCIMTSPRRLFQ